MVAPVLEPVPHPQLAKAVYSDRGSELALSGSCRPYTKEYPSEACPEGEETPPFNACLSRSPAARLGSSIFSQMNACP